METYDVKNYYCPQATRVDSGREEYINSIQIDWSWYTVILYGQSLQIFFRGKKFYKNYLGNFTFENSKRCKCFIFIVATGRWRILIVATATGPACQ
jgi:hypothetical protein